jgi:hypothetical protein
MICENGDTDAKVGDKGEFEELQKLYTWTKSGDFLT